MERLIIGEVGVLLDDGVDKYKFVANARLQIDASAVAELFTSFGYDVNTIPGGFVKSLTLNAKELEEVKEVLGEIEAMGLKQVFEANMRLACFKRSFLKRLEKYKNAGVPYLNSDNTFVSTLFSTEDPDKYLIKANENSQMSVPDNTITINSGDEKDNSLGIMDEFDRGLFNEISKNLNYMILANPTNGVIVNIVQSILGKLSEAILRKEYQFLGVSGMISNIMEGLGVDLGSTEAQTILSAIPEAEVGRGRAA